MKAAHYAIVLGLICIAAALGVAGAYSVTRERIVKKERQEKLTAVSAVVDAAAGDSFQFDPVNPKAEESEQVTVARRADGAVAGYAGQGEAQGYGGKIRVIVGMDAKAEKVIGVTVLPHKETPGLGSRVAEVESSDSWWGMLTDKSAKADGDEPKVPEYLKQFRGLGLGQIRLKGDGGSIQAITGATISSTGVVDATRNAVEKIQDTVRACSSGTCPVTE